MTIVQVLKIFRTPNTRARPNLIGHARRIEQAAGK
jgi:hypothetical protein